MKKNKFCLLLVLLFFCSFCFSEDDDLIDDFFSELNIGDEIDEVNEDEFYISRIKISISGKTRESWVREKLLLKEDKLYPEKQYKNLAKWQKNYFLDTHLFYSVDIYLIPDSKAFGNGLSYCCCIDLVDGFMQMYMFWPWDIQWGIRHLLGGEETLTVTLGYNTQGIEWDRPLVFDTPFSYFLSANHFYGDFDLETKINYFDCKSKLYGKFSELMEVGIAFEYKKYSCTLQQVGSGQFIKLGGFINLFPEFQVFNPLSMNVYLGTGYNFSLCNEPDFFFDVSMKVLYHPVDFFSAELFGNLNYTDLETLYILKPSTEKFRSSIVIPRENIFYHAYLQINFERVLIIPLGFTKISCTPYLFYEIADSKRTFGDFSTKDINNAIGSAVAFYVESPVNLIFSFGAKCNLDSERSIKFHFAVTLSLY